MIDSFRITGCVCYMPRFVSHPGYKVTCPRRPFGKDSVLKNAIYQSNNLSMTCRFGIYVEWPRVLTYLATAAAAGANTEGLISFRGNNCRRVPMANSY